MSLSKKLALLDGNQKKEIELNLQEVFPNSVAVQVFFCILEWIDSQSGWDGDVSEAEARSVMNSVMTALQGKISRTEDQNEISVLQYLHSSLQCSYRNKPVELLHRLSEIHYLVDKMLSEACQSPNDNETENQSVDFKTKIEILENLIKENNTHIRNIQQKLKERKIQLFSQDELEIEKLKITNENASHTQQEKNVKISEITKRINRLNNDITKTNQSIISSLKLLCENIKVLVNTKNKDLQNSILEEISLWNFNQQRAQIGCPVFSLEFLLPLIPVCTKFADILSETCKQTQKLVEFLIQTQVNKEYLEPYEKMKQTSNTMLSSFLKRCLVVDKQPPQILATDKTFSVSLRLLLGSSFLSTRYPPTVTCSLHLDDEISCFYLQSFQNVQVKAENLNNVKNNKKAFTYDKETDSFTVCFDKMSLNKPDQRKTKRGENKTSKLVTDQKSCLMFQSEISIGPERHAQSYKVEALSLPLVVIRNTSQHVESEATIFWDNAFADKDRKPFIVPERVPLNDFLEALNNRWSKSNELELQQHHLDYLAKKLLPDKKKQELNQSYVTKEMFHKENMKGFKFTFWTWFYKNMILVEKYLLDEWRDNKIYGFIDKRDAESKLNECLVGTFLLRFSDSIPGGISIAYKESMQGCNHVRPWVKDEFKQKSFSDGLRDLQYDKDLNILAYLYPSTPKDQAFEMYYSQTDENASDEVDPRYPKKANVHVVRGSVSALSLSSNPSSSLPSTSFASADVMMSENNDGNVSPGLLPLEDDPLWGQAYGFSANDSDLEKVDELDKDLFNIFSELSTQS